MTGSISDVSSASRLRDDRRMQRAAIVRASASASGAPRRWAAHGEVGRVQREVRHRRSPVGAVVGCPVRARKTSSSVASWTEKRRTASRSRIDLVEQRADVRGAAVGRDAELQAGAVARRSRARRARRRRPRRRAASASTRSRRWSATRRLSCCGVPSATTRPPSMTAMRSASRSASSRYWVVRKTVVAAADEPLDLVPHRQAAARIEAGGRLVEEDHLRPCDEARREVQAPAHAAGVRRDPPARRPSARSKRSSSSLARARASRADRPSSRPIMRRFSAPVWTSSTAAYWPVRLIAPAHLAAVARRRRSPPRGRCRRRRATSVARIRTVVVLPAPLGPSSEKTVPRRDGEVDAVEDAQRAVGLREARRLDRRLVAHGRLLRSVAYASAYHVRCIAYVIHSERDDAQANRSAGRASRPPGAAPRRRAAGRARA